MRQATRSVVRERSRSRHPWIARPTSRALMALLAAFLLAPAHAHPTGSMVVHGDTLLWSYVCPVESPDHVGCVMRWDTRSDTRSDDAEPEPWVTSERPASDWLIAPTVGDAVLLVERAYDASSDQHRVRILEGTPPHAPRIVRDWFADEHRFGEAGFAPLPDGDLLFARYPHLYLLADDGSAERWEAWTEDVTGLRFVPPDRLLIRGEDAAWLTSLEGEIVVHWPDLLEDPTGPLPFLGNRIFDAAYAQDPGEDAASAPPAAALWLAYWGQRRFDVLHGDERRTVHAVSFPFLPHAVAADGASAYLLASSLEPGHDIRPRLWRWTAEGLERIWGMP